MNPINQIIIWWHLQTKRESNSLKGRMMKKRTKKLDGKLIRHVSFCNNPFFPHDIFNLNLILIFLKQSQTTIQLRIVMKNEKWNVSWGNWTSIDIPLDLWTSIRRPINNTVLAKTDQATAQWVRRRNQGGQPSEPSSSSLRAS